MVQSYHSTDLATPTKNSQNILSERSDFHMIDYLPVAVHAFPLCILISFSVDEILLVRDVNCSTNFRGNVAEIQFEQVYLQEAFDHLHSLHLW